MSLAKELTKELQTVVNFETAELAAPRIAVINKRYQDAGVQVFALNGTALLSSADRSSEYVDALTTLSSEIGRVRASKPVTEADSDIDTDELIKAVGNTAQEGLSASKRKEVGVAYMKNSTDSTHATTGTFAEYYGSDALGDALAYVADPAETSMFSMGEEPAEIPEKAAAPAPADDEEEAPAADEEDSEEASDEEAAEEEASEEEASEEE